MKPRTTLIDHGGPIDKSGTRFVEEEVPIFCGICGGQIPAKELACRNCYNTTQPKPRVRMARVNPDDPEGLFAGLPAIHL